MARRPLTGLLSQYAKNAGGAAASGYWLKLYKNNSSSNVVDMYTLQSGGATLDKCVLNSRGEPTSVPSDDDSTFIPYVEEDYDAYLFFTEADADANNTTNSIFLGQNIQGELVLVGDLPDYIAAEFATVSDMISGNSQNLGAIDFADYVGRTVVLNESGRFGEFQALSGNFSSLVSDDSQNGVYIAPSSDPTGSSGCYVRKISEGDKGTLRAEWFGAVGDWNGSSGTDNSVPINAAITLARNNRDLYSTVKVGIGQFALGNPVKIRQGVSFLGVITLAGNVGGTEFICNFSQSVIDNPPTDTHAGERFDPTLEYTPMIYNTELLTQQNIGGFRLNGNDLDVYGLWIHELFYMHFFPMFIIECLQSPFTVAVGQFNTLNKLALINNDAGGRVIGCDSFIFDGLDTEANSVSGSQFDVVADVSIKSAVVVNAWHHEESATRYPTTLGRVSGRMVVINEVNFAMSSSNPNHYLELIGAESYTWDGSTFTTIPAIGCTCDNLNFSLTNGSVQFDSGAVGNYVRVTNIPAVVDNSASVTNQIDSLTTAQVLPRGVKITNSSGGNHLSFPDDNTVNFYSNLNRNLRQSGANWVMENLGGNIDISPSGNVNVNATDVVNIVSGNYRIAGLPTSSGGLPSNTLWNDSGTLKIT